MLIYTMLLLYVLYSLDKHRGFAFVEFELQEDAAAAIDNMVSVLMGSLQHF